MKERNTSKSNAVVPVSKEKRHLRSEHIYVAFFKAMQQLLTPYESVIEAAIQEHRTTNIHIQAMPAGMDAFAVWVERTVGGFAHEAGKHYMDWIEVRDLIGQEPFKTGDICRIRLLFETNAAGALVKQPQKTDPHELQCMQDALDGFTRLSKEQGARLIFRGERHMSFTSDGHGWIFDETPEIITPKPTLADDKNISGALEGMPPLRLSDASHSQ